jgi:predicted AAA+ superfamily ATPase
MTLKPWREVAIPHEDVLKGTFQQAEFAADLSRVHDGTATPEYQDPVLFYQRTFITEGMKLLLDSVVKRIAGRGGDPVIQLQTAFGGGKTHTMLAVYHLAKGTASSADLAGIPPILDAAKITELPRATIAVLDGNQLAPNMPRKRDGLTVRTLWGELAWQLGGESGYALVREADESGTSPGKDVLARLLGGHAPCVVLVDELVAYIRQFEEGKSYAGGTYDSNLSFIQALTEALKMVPSAVLLASLPESDREAGSQRGQGALNALEHYFGRVQALWKPVGTEEAFEIVRRRLFTKVNDAAAADAVCRAFAELYVANPSLPQETQDSRYTSRMRDAYPIHPEVFRRLYEDWSTLESFQRTRGVLKLMAKVIYRLWKDGNNDLLILPANLPLYDADVRNEVIYYLPPGWDPVVESDIDGERAETTEIENKEPRLGSVQGCRRAARAIFLGSAPTTTGQRVRGLEVGQVLLGCLQPDQQLSLYEDALNRLVDRLHYLNQANDRYWFDTRPNLRREMEERKKRFQDREDILPVIRERLQKSLTPGLFGGVHVFTPAADIPDDWSLRLVVLPTEAAYNRAGHGLAIQGAAEILKHRGEQPRQKQNRLLFLAADYDSVSRLKDLVRTLLAWQSIVNDYRDNRIVLDNLMARNAEAALAQARETLTRMVREVYRWLLAPMQEALPPKGVKAASGGTPAFEGTGVGGVSEIKWEAFPLNPSSPDLGKELALVLRENELVISEWAPIHLAKMLTTWFWKAEVVEVGALEVWQKTCQYLYLPRLKDEEVFRRALVAGAGSTDFFGFAYGKEAGKYTGFSFGKLPAPVFDGSLLIIEPRVAREYAAAEAAASTGKPGGTVGGGGGEGVIADPPGGTGRGTGGGGLGPGGGAGRTGGGAKAPVQRRFYGTISLDAVQAKKRFADLVDELVIRFTERPGVNVQITVEIHAESAAGFDENLQRTIRENARTLGFRDSEFEGGE